MKNGTVAIVVFVVLVVFGFLAYILATKNKTSATKMPAAGARPVPQASWTMFDWFKNGYTQSEYDAATAAQGVVSSGLNDLKNNFGINLFGF